MKSKLFAELLGAANEMLEHRKDQRGSSNPQLPQAPAAMTAGEIRQIRDSLQASQGVLARYLNVSTKLVQAWEAGVRTPSGPALVLLRIVEREPRLIDALYADSRLEASQRVEPGSAASRKGTRQTGRGDDAPSI